MTSKLVLSVFRQLFPHSTFAYFALALFVTYAFLVFFSRSGYADNLSLFLTLMTTSNAIVFGFFYYLWRNDQSPSAKFVFLWALTFHIIGIFGMPIFEDDYFRYLWDAYHTVNLGTPYGIAPSDYFSSETITSNTTINPQFQTILGQINYPDIPTIYGPVLQYSFLLGYAASPGEVWPLQLLYSAADMLVIVLLLRLATPRFVLLYAWSPLVFKEIILTAHPDGVGVLLLISAVWSHHRGHLVACALFLAMSVAAKVFAILLVPYLLIRAKVKHGVLFVLTLVLLYIPLLINSDSDVIGLKAMAQAWEFNSALFGLLLLGFSAQTSKLLLASLLLIFMAGYLFYYYKSGQPTPANRHSSPQHHSNSIVRGDWVMGLFLLCAPVINPWYLVWVLPFAVIHPRLTVWVASSVIMLAYIVGLNVPYTSELGPYDQPIWARLIEFGVIGLVAGYEIWRYYSSRTYSLNS